MAVALAFGGALGLAGGGAASVTFLLTRRDAAAVRAGASVFAFFAGALAGFTGLAASDVAASDLAGALGDFFAAGFAAGAVATGDLAAAFAAAGFVLVGSAALVRAFWLARLFGLTTVLGVAAMGLAGFFAAGLLAALFFSAAFAAGFAAAFVLASVFVLASALAGADVFGEEVFGADVLAAGAAASVFFGAGFFAAAVFSAILAAGFSALFLAAGAAAAFSFFDSTGASGAFFPEAFADLLADVFAAAADFDFGACAISRPPLRPALSSRNGEIEPKPVLAARKSSARQDLRKTWLAPATSSRKTALSQLSASAPAPMRRIRAPRARRRRKTHIFMILKQNCARGSRAGARMSGGFACANGRPRRCVKTFLG